MKGMDLCGHCRRSIVCISQLHFILLFIENLAFYFVGATWDQMIEDLLFNCAALIRILSQFDRGGSKNARFRCCDPNDSGV